MKWIETSNGNYVNLEKVALIDIVQDESDYQVRAIFPVSCGADNFPMTETIVTYESYSEAKFYVDNLLKGEQVNE